jgi:hypothetical protein
MSNHAAIHNILTKHIQICLYKRLYKARECPVITFSDSK